MTARRLWAGPRGRLTLGRLGRPVFWSLLVVFILVPCACSLILTISPRLFDQGTQWFTLSYLASACTGATAVAITNSLWVSAAAAALGLAIGFPVAWLAVMYRLGLDLPFVTHAIMGPSGVVLLIVPMLAPAIWSALAIGFAESISDFGIAATLAYNSSFSLATYQLYAQINNFPPSFPAASAMGCLLVAAVAISLALQARALRGRSYQMLAGRTRQAVRRRLSRPGAAVAVAAVGLFYLLALGVPGFGAVSGSVLGDFGGSFSLTLVNYRTVLHQAGPLERSIIYAAIGGHGHGGGRFHRRLDAGAAPGHVLPPARFPAAVRDRAAQRGLRGRLHLRLQPPGAVPARHRPAPDGHAAGDRLRRGQPADQHPGPDGCALPAAGLTDGRRPHARLRRAGRVGARGLPVVSRPLVMVWLLTFCGVFLELPISQLLYEPGSPPASVAIQDNLGNYHFGIGMAQSVLAVAIAMAVVAGVLAGYRLLAPAGWRRIGGTSRG